MIRSLKTPLPSATPKNITAQRGKRLSPAWTVTVATTLCLSATTAVPASAQPVPATPDQTQTQTSAYADSSHRPIVFVHGWNSDKNVWSGMRNYAKTQGYKESELHSYDYSEMTKSGKDNPGIDVIAEDFSKEANRIAKTSPDGKVDVVAHSMGGLVARAYIKKLGGVDKVKHFVSMGSPHHGTIVADVGTGASDVARIAAFLWRNNGLVGRAAELAKKCDQQCRDMASGSSFLRSLNSGDEAPQGIDGYPRYTTFRSNVDDEPAIHTNSRNGGLPQIGLCDGVVFGITAQGSWAYEGNGPNVRGGKTSTLRGADNVVTTCLSHDGYYSDPWTQEKALDALTETTNGEKDKHAPKMRNRTECNELSRTNSGDNWVQAWLQSCLEVSPEKEVTPVLRIRGCGHYRQPFGITFWYYTPQGYGDNVQCVMTRQDLSLSRKESKNRNEPGSHEAAFATRAGEVRVANLSLQGAGNYQLYSANRYNPHSAPQVSVKIQTWNDRDNYAALNPPVEGPSVTVR